MECLYSFSLSDFLENFRSDLYFDLFYFFLVKCEIYIKIELFMEVIGNVRNIGFFR